MIPDQLRDRALTGLAFVMTAAVAMLGAQRLRTFYEPPDVPDLHRPRVVADWTTYGRGGEAIGPDAESATVTIVVFADYRCAACKGANETLSHLRRSYPDDLRLVYWQFPILGDISLRAATLAKCAAREGEFERVHTALFAASETIGLKRSVALAAEAGITDTTALATCLEDGTGRAAVALEQAVGQALDLRGVPAVMVDSLLFSGTPTSTYLRPYLRSAIRRHRGSLSDTR